MKTQQGKFVLFLDVLQFAAWLDSAVFSRVIRLLQCHHTYIPSYSNFQQTNHFELLQGMENAHLQRGFSEIAQNLTTFPDGSVAVCRPIDTIPAGIKGANKDGICIENLGDFDVGQDTPTAKHQATIVSVFALLSKKFNLHPDSQSIVFHHWYDQTTGERTNGTGCTKTCPGTGFFGGDSVANAEQSFIPLVAQQLATYSGSTPIPQPQPLHTADVQVDRLNVRSQPSTNAPILKQLTRGIEVPVYDEQNGWCRIDGLNSLWVDAQFLVATGTPTQVQAMYPAQVTANLLNVRTLPSLTGPIANQLNRGTNVFVYEEREGWCRIDPADSLWVSNSYLARRYSAAAIS